MFIKILRQMRTQSAPVKLSVRLVTGSVHLTLLAADIANAIQIMQMTAQHKTVLFADLPLQGFNPLVIDFYDFPTGQADDMVMVAVWPGYLIPGNAIFEMDLCGKTSITQQLERTVHRGLPDTRIQLEHMLVELFQRMVAGQFKKSLGNNLALGRGIKPVATHEGQKVTECLAALLVHNQPLCFCSMSCADCQGAGDIYRFKDAERR